MSGEARSPKLLVGVRILVVESEPDSRELLDAVLAYCGALVCHASSAREALAQAHSVAPDIVVADVTLPGDDGYRLIHQLRALAGGVGALPAVALASGREHTADRALAAGFDAHVRKPIDPWEFCRIIAGLVRKA